MTKKRKKELNHICEFCKKSAELEAAHVKESSRKEIIESILIDYISKSDKNLVIVDLDKFEEKITASHKPLDKYFKFLCAECHKTYDKKLSK